MPPPPVIPLLLLTSAYTPHDTVHSHGLRNLEIIVFNLEAALVNELVSLVALVMIVPQFDLDPVGGLVSGFL